MKQFDPQNLMIIDGEIHALTTQEVSNPDDPLGHTCMYCSIQAYCQPSGHPACLLIDGTIDEYLVKIGRVMVDEKTKKPVLEIQEDWKPII